MLSEAEIALVAAASKVDSCHAHMGCGRCHPGLTEALDAFMKAHPEIDFSDLLDDYWFGRDRDAAKETE